MARSWRCGDGWIVTEMRIGAIIELGGGLLRSFVLGSSPKLHALIRSHRDWHICRPTGRIRSQLISGSLGRLQNWRGEGSLGFAFHDHIRLPLSSPRSLWIRRSRLVRVGGVGVAIPRQAPVTGLLPVRLGHWLDGINRLPGTPRLIGHRRASRFPIGSEWFGQVRRRSVLGWAISGGLVRLDPAS